MNLLSLPHRNGESSLILPELKIVVGDGVGVVGHLYILRGGPKILKDSRKH